MARGSLNISNIGQGISNYFSDNTMGIAHMLWREEPFDMTSVDAQETRTARGSMVSTPAQGLESATSSTPAERASHQ